MKRVKVISMTIVCVLGIALLTGSAFAVPIGIVNGDFETGADNDAPPAGWTDNSSSASFWLGGPDEPVGTNIGNPIQAEWDSAPAPGLGTLILTTARQSAGVGSQPVDGQLVQTVDLSAFAIDIDAGDQTLLVDFIYGSDDYRDTGIFSLHFFDALDVELGSGYSVALDDASNGDWSFTGWLDTTVGGLVPVSARSVMLQIDTTRTGGSETNIWIDNISGNMVPEPATMMLLGLGGLLLRRRK